MIWNLALDDLRLFSRLVQQASLSAVARERGVPVSQVSRALARMEKACGAPLLHRSTHGLSPTAEGSTLAAHCETLLASLEQLEGELAGPGGAVQGPVCVAASTVVAEHLLLPSLPELCRLHPGLRIDLRVDDRMVDMVGEGIDIAIRSGEPVGDTLVARRLGTLSRGLYAAPSYARAHGLPASIAELAAHRLITNSAVPVLNRWRFKPAQPGEPERVFIAEGAVKADTTAIITGMALAGLGIARVNTQVAETFVRQGRLLPVLPAQFLDTPVPIYAGTLNGRHRLPRIRACLDYWAEHLERSAGDVRFLPDSGSGLA